MVWLKRGEGHAHRKKNPLRNLIGIWLEQLGWKERHTYLQSGCIQGKADTAVCAQREGRKAMEDSKFHFIRLHNGPSRSGKTSLSAGSRGLAINLVSERVKSRMEVGWDCTPSKLPHPALWFLEVSQFNLLTFGFHFQKRIRWMTQSVILDLLFYSDAAKSRPSTLDTRDLWPVINLVTIINCH